MLAFVIETHMFEQVADAVRSMAADIDDDLRLRWHRRGVKAWFGPEKPPREHYEAQLIARRHIDGIEGMAIEIGFHAEHREPAKNEAVLLGLVDNEKSWRKALGPEPEAAVFLGADGWRRVSETWIEPDLDDPDLAFEMAARLVDYLAAIEAVR